jgi:hypothetical protein
MNGAATRYVHDVATADLGTFVVTRPGGYAVT